ncbi:hypothetical protein [Caviibacterium pharyngocola]|uniref:Uncharacterized protein n=1 Tax=Caviibacterium pharyngocola TaxID=28159 RepID=A0A2M8RY35_9PAST|nr:hypothetical protein [Caviibacterium pharyngocola]PJG83792.1 hypothetical protein CVP04_01490 [Caviibacterium pharyngocola]
MARQDIIDTAYALRREGVEIVQSKDGRFPQFLILRPSKRLMAKAVKLTERINGKRRERFVAMQGKCAVFWY